MRNRAFGCMNQECKHEFISSSMKDGTRCPKCDSRIVPLREATAEEMHNMDKRYKSKTPQNSITVTLTLDGYESIIGQLKDIERHIDRIIEKQKLLEVGEADIDLIGCVDG